MQYSKERPKNKEEIRKKLGDFIPDHEDRLSLIVSVTGIMKLLSDHIVTTADPKKLDPKTGYGMMMAFHYLQMMQLIANGSLDGGDKVEFGHMPSDELAWKSDDDFNKRLLLVVKHMYEDFVKKGKVQRKNFTINSEAKQQ